MVIYLESMQQTGVFRTADDEEQVQLVLRAYIEEWGAENVLVSVPSRWRHKSNATLGKVKLDFSTVDTVAVSVGLAGLSFAVGVTV